MAKRKWINCWCSVDSGTVSNKTAQSSVNTMPDPKSYIQFESKMWTGIPELSILRSLWKTERSVYPAQECLGSDAFGQVSIL